MFAYFIIAIELLILYTVFWYVFLREPKPYRIKGNAWGAYDGPDLTMQRFAQGYPNMQGGRANDCDCKADQEHKKRSATAIYEEWNAPHDGVTLTAGELIRSQSRGVERASSDSLKNPLNGKNTGDHPKMQYSQRVQAPAYLPFNPAEQYRTKSSTLPGFLAELGDKLNRINVKLP
jgi:hypothetical protein